MVPFVVVVGGLTLIFTAWIGFRRPGASAPSFPFGRYPMPWRAQAHLNPIGVTMYSIGAALLWIGIGWRVLSLFNGA